MDITSENNKDSLIVSEEVLSSIAINSATDVDGVSSFSNRPVDVMTTIKRGSLKVMSPVRIVPDGDNISVSIYLNIEPNKEIKPIAEGVQHNVKEAIENMTGKCVTKVNVVIAGIDFNEDGDSTEPTTSEN